MRARLTLFLVLLLMTVTAVSAQSLSFGNTSVSAADLADLVKVESGEPNDFNSTNGTVKIFDREHGLNMPTGYILLVLAFLLIVVYSVDIDPFWIAILLFLLVFTAIVYYLRLPKYSIIAVMLLIMLVKHFR